tara:strand:+ start:844 stop:972 length:129 start_codon:yes stop_codon:yes gene_type:complete
MMGLNIKNIPKGINAVIAFNHEEDNLNVNELCLKFLKNYDIV